MFARVLDVPEARILDLFLVGIRPSQRSDGGSASPVRHRQQADGPSLDITAGLTARGTSSQSNGMAPMYSLTASSICSSKGW